MTIAPAASGVGPTGLLRGLLCAGLLLAASPAPAPAAELEFPDRTDLEDALPEGASLSGQEIYRRFLANRFQAATAELRVVSASRGGATQKTELQVRWKDRGERDRPSVVSKTLIRFVDPFDVRGMAYLIIANQGRAHDQFAYLPSHRKTRRLRAHGVGVLGTEFTLDDLIYQTVDDATYDRLPDEVFEGVPVYVVKAALREHVKSDYRFIVASIEKDHYVLVRALYLNAAEDPMRELRAKVDTLTQFDGIWIATESRMTDLKQLTHSTMHIERLNANPDLDDRDFSYSRLGHRDP